MFHWRKERHYLKIEESFTLRNSYTGTLARHFGTSTFLHLKKPSTFPATSSLSEHKNLTATKVNKKNSTTAKKVCIIKLLL